MKSSINARYNVYAPKAERNSAIESRHTDRLSAQIKVKLPRSASSLEQMRLGHASIKQRCDIQCEALAFTDEHKWLHDLN